MKKNNKKILSICVPVFYRVLLLKRLLKSIKCNEPKLIEIIIIDDGSTDNIKGLIDQYKKKNKKITYKYFRQKNMGVAHAMINAYKKSNGEYCIKMDTDDIFLPNGVNNILSFLDKNKDFIKKNKKICGVIFGTNLIFKEKKIINQLPNNIITNFLELKADLGVNFDCKEVVSRNVILKKQIYISRKIRVVQQSWFLIANFYDCISSKIIVAQKEYLEDGLSSNSGINYKVKESKILAKINLIISKSDKYKSKIFRYKSEILTQKYALHSNQNYINNFRDFIFSLLAWPLYKYEQILYKSIYKNK